MTHLRDRPSRNAGGGGFAVHPDEETSITTGTGNGFAGENGRLSSPTGSHLRINHPIGAEIHVRLPTTNARDIRVTYETRRSEQGAGLQTIHYSVDGTTFHFFDHRMVHATDPAVQVLNFREFVGADNNPDFTLRITFDQAMGGGAGNNRFDNFLVEGVLIDAPSHDDLDLWLLN
ncbi:MAG: hypothetical protein JJU11_09605 [Candidatus Sumerlaeia bacterium]|nr:hypothetical protein [Candidatus Sumerlaeia bacterium]